MRWFIRLILTVFVGILVGCRTNTAITNNNRGNEQLRRGEVDISLEAYQRAQVNAPDEALPYYNAGVALLEAERFEDAIAAFGQSLKTAESTVLVANIYFGLGEAYFRQNDFRQAATAYQQVLLIDPENEDARYNFELTLEKMPTSTPTTTVTDAVSQASTTPTPSETTTPDEPGAGSPTVSPTPNMTSTALGTPTETATPTGIPQPEQGEDPTPENEVTPTGNPDDPNDPAQPDPTEPPLAPESALELLEDMQEQQQVIPFDSSDDTALGSVVEKDW